VGKRDFRSSSASNVTALKTPRCAYRKSGEDVLNRALAAGEREMEAQKQVKAMLEGKSVSGRDRAKLRR
jgi:hypothetical protein